MSDTDQQNQKEIQAHQNRPETRQVRAAEADEQEALWARSLQFFEAMNGPQAVKHAKV